MERPKKREGHQLLLRFAEGSDLRDRLQQAAAANNRTLTQEILFRLEGSLQADTVEHEPKRTGGLSFMQTAKGLSLVSLHERVEALAARIKALEER